ncbi:MAG: hypothetical protein F6J92_04335 [Symploca sp. SIO1A3]|nr:hypothetical protein [Symploca sp. SIO1A3]
MSYQLNTAILLELRLYYYKAKSKTCCANKFNWRKLGEIIGLLRSRDFRSRTSRFDYSAQ